jgi:flagellar motor switch protein FliN/FliY
MRFPSTPSLETLLPDDPQTDNMSLVLGVTIAVTARLGTRRMALREVLELGPNAVIELDRVAGSPVDVLANDRLIARGDIVAVDGAYGIRITELIVAS